MSDVPLYITKEARDKLWGYTMALKEEVGGFGFGTIDLQDRLVWYDCFLVDQDVSTGGVDFTDKGIAQAIERAAEQNVFSDPNFFWVWWHSHNSMGVFWSSTDEGGVRALKASGVKHMVSVVVNHKMESKIRLDWFDAPMLDHVTVGNFKLAVYPDDVFQQEIAAELKDYVRLRSASWHNKGKTQSGYQTGSPGGKKDDKPWAIDKSKDKGDVVKSTRSDDPGERLEAILTAKERQELAMHERSESAFVSGGSIGDDVDDDGVAFNWTKVVDWVPDKDERDEWLQMGLSVVQFQGEYFLLEPDEPIVIENMASDCGCGLDGSCPTCLADQTPITTGEVVS